MAWLNTAPGKSKVTRLDQYKRKHGGESPPMPDVEHADHLIGYLFEVGPTMPAGMGAGPVSFLEIDAWSTLTGTPLSSWESLALREMSCAYVAMQERAKDRNCPNPWRSAPADPQDVADEMDRQFARMESVAARSKRRG